jgi:light-harvesting protein B-800-850 alpha chain
MIYGKMWTVVRPTVGVPIFIGAVAVGSFCVHLAIVSNTTWVRGFLNGSASKAAVTAPAMAAAPAEAAATQK